MGRGEKGARWRKFLGEGSGKENLLGGGGLVKSRQDSGCSEWTITSSHVNVVVYLPTLLSWKYNPMYLVTIAFYGDTHCKLDLGSFPNILLSNRDVGKIINLGFYGNLLHELKGRPSLRSPIQTSKTMISL